MYQVITYNIDTAEIHSVTKDFYSLGWARKIADEDNSFYIRNDKRFRAIVQ